jgi:hypothetical protein
MVNKKLQLGKPSAKTPGFWALPYVGIMQSEFIEKTEK